MTRKDYELIAGAINESVRQVLPQHRGALIDVTERLALALKEDNPRFACERFRIAALEAS